MVEWKTLEEFRVEVWHMLVKAIHKNTEAREATLATWDKDAPDARTVILREANSENHSLIAYSDWRAEKIRHIRRNGQVVWVRWDRKQKYQVRFYGTCVLHHEDELARSHWESLSVHGRRIYSCEPGPGTQVPDFETGVAAYASAEASEAEQENWYPNFAVLHTEVHAYDVLLLHPDGHRRALFTLKNNEWQSEWQVP